MILFLLQWMEKVMHVPAAFAYSSTRMLLAALTALVLTIGLGPLFIRKLYEQKFRQPIRKEACPLLGKLHSKKENTPTMGGGLMLLAIAAALLLWMDLKNSFTLVLFFALMSFAVIGGIDDYLKLKWRSARGLKSRWKSLFQLLVAAAIASYLFVPQVTNFLHRKSYFTPPTAKECFTQEVKVLTLQQYSGQYFIPFYKNPLLILSGTGLAFAFLMTVFVIVGSSNAVNLTDGLDGLAAGCIVLVSGVIAAFAFLSNNAAIAEYLNILYIEGSGEIAIFLSAIFGAALGFLWYNGHPAQVFMGDIGSLCLGGLLGTASVLLRREFLLALVGGIFVVEALSVILQVASFRLRNKKRLFLCAPLHHHFEYKGWNEVKVVTRFWIVGLLLALVGLISLRLQ